MGLLKVPLAFLVLGTASSFTPHSTLINGAGWTIDGTSSTAMAKLYTGELSNRVVNAALQIRGGYGYREESAIARMYRD